MLCFDFFLALTLAFFGLIFFSLGKGVVYFLSRPSPSYLYAGVLVAVGGYVVYILASPAFQRLYVIAYCKYVRGRVRGRV
jgi:hypothetical protein